MIIWAFILARKGSKRCPNKNTMTFDDCGSIVHRALRRCGEVYQIKRVVLDSDIPEYIEDYKNSSRIHFIERDPSLAGDNANPADVVHGDLLKMMHETGQRPDCIVLLQATSPVWDTIHLSHAISLLEVNDLPAIFSVNPAYKPNGCFYLVRTDVFLMGRTFFPEGAKVLRMKWKESIDIDNPWDFVIAQAELWEEEERDYYG